MHLTVRLIRMCMMVERSDMSKFTEGSWQGSFTVNKERAVLASKKVGNHDIHGPKKKNYRYTHLAIQVQAFRRKPKRLSLLRHNNKA